MARPSKLNDEITQTICENIELGLSYNLTCQAAGISFDTFDNWMKSGAKGEQKKCTDFYNQVRASEAVCARNSLTTIREDAINGSWSAAAWLLERRYASDYGRKDNLNLKSKTENVNVSIDLQEADEIRSEILRRLSCEIEPGC